PLRRISKEAIGPDRGRGAEAGGEEEPVPPAARRAGAVPHLRTRGGRRGPRLRRQERTPPGLAGPPRPPPVGRPLDPLNSATVHDDAHNRRLRHGAARREAVMESVDSP